MGRITGVTKTVDSVNYPLAYAYNSAGELTSITYPSGRVVTQQYDAIGRVNLISSGGTNYLSSVVYNAAHQPTSFTYGNGVVADPAYNSRFQLASLTYTKNTTKLLDLAYSYTSATHTGNNGQITKVQDNTGTQEAGRTADYTYDAWSRVKTAQTTGSASYPQWGLSWDYDRYGNRKNQNVTAGSAPAPQLAISPTTNRITSTGYAYDSSGNLTNDTVYNYTYDGENRIIQAKQGTTVLSTSTYDGSSLRVKKVAGSNTTRYIFSGTKVIAEYLNGSLNKEYVYSGSQLLATLNSSGTPTYHHPDHLSIRVNSDTSGTIVGQQGHYPFGESWYSQSTTTKWQFTSYERDAESSLDYAIFRYDSSRLGRFQTPDPLAGSIADPQTLNRYAYVRNDPVNLVDPLGLCYFITETVCLPSGYCFTYQRTVCQETVEVTAQGGGETIASTFWEFGMGSRGIPAPFLDAPDIDWWGAFFKSLPQELKNYWKKDCFALFLKETGNNVVTPGASSLGPVAGAAYGDVMFNRALQYAATTPSRTFGTPFLVYPNKSSVFRGLMSQARSGAAVGVLLTIDIAMTQALITQANAAARGDCE